jgi:hypothetical protein
MRIACLICSLLLVVGILAMPTYSRAQVAVGVSVRIAPPELPIYEQPRCPAEGYIWTPGYWAWGDDDYFWVPGTWVLAPQVGFFWTPGYWAWGGNSFIFYEGYWGPVVGFYGGINYGYGYFGRGYEGGRWDNGRFYYNRSVNNVNVTEIHNVYDTRVVNNTTVTRVSYNGGNGGINERPTPQEEAAVHERHLPPVAAQTQHVQTAHGDPALRVSENHGKPPVAATPKPAAFSDRGESYPPKREDVTPRRLPGRRITPLVPTRRSTLTNFHLPRAPRPTTPRTQTWTKNTNNSRASYTSSKSKSARNSSKNRIRNTRESRNKKRMKRESSS